MLGGACGDHDFVCTVPEVSERDVHTRVRSGDTKDSTHRGSPSRLWPFPTVSGAEVRYNVACYLCIKKHVSEGAGDQCWPDITKSLVFSDRQIITVPNSTARALPSRTRNEAASDADEYHRSRALRSDCCDTAGFDVAGIRERLRRTTKKRAPTQEMHLSSCGEQSPLGSPTSITIRRMVSYLNGTDAHMWCSPADTSAPERILGYVFGASRLCKRCGSTTPEERVMCPAKVTLSRASFALNSVTTRRRWRLRTSTTLHHCAQPGVAQQYPLATDPVKPKA